MFLDNINFTVRSKPEARDSQRPKWKDRIRSKLVFPSKHIRLNIKFFVVYCSTLPKAQWMHCQRHNACMQALGALTLPTT